MKGDRKIPIFIYCLIGCLLLIAACSKKKYPAITHTYTPSVIEVKKMPSKKHSAVVITVLEEDTIEPAYRQANHAYNRQLREFVRTIEEKKAFQSDSLCSDSSYWVSTVHFNLRKPQYVVIHHTAQNSIERTLYTFTVNHTKVSAHYLIGRDGEVIHLLNDYLRAWHAGTGCWGSLTDLNSVSIGIELDNNGFEPFSDIQINSLLLVLDSLKTRYNIPQANFIGHSDIAPGRKQDPSAYFPWQRLAEKGFGRWYSPNLVEPPETFNPMDALRIIGYDTSSEENAIEAFNLHYLPYAERNQMTDSTRMIIYDLYKK